MKCDGLDCKREATKLSYLGKSGADVRLCEVCFTRFALRGLLRTTGKLGAEIFSQDISGYSESAVGELVHLTLKANN